MSNVTVIGTTSWGLTLANQFAANGHEVVVLTRTSEEAALLAAKRQSARLPGVVLRDKVSFVADVSLALLQARLLVIAVPSASLRGNLERIQRFVPASSAVLSAVKGVEPETGLLMSQVIASASIELQQTNVLSGPNFAREIAHGLPAATVVAGPDSGRRKWIQELLNGPTFRVYTSDDVTGVELGGALKNVVAIACGISDGLGYGENAKAALITRALAEITRLGVAAGARPLTFLGLAGMGDLILTCQSDLSRNRRLGLALAKGASLGEALAGIDGVVEGAVTARAVPMLARKYGVELPICAALHAVLYEGLGPRQAVQELMARASRAELDGLDHGL